MALQEEVDLLRNIPLFAKIEPSKLKLIAFTSDRMTFRRGDFLCRQGEAGDSAFVIVSGEADVSVETPGGKLHVATLRQNDILGEIAILCDVPRTATVTAISDVETLVISKELFFRLIHEFPQIAIELLRELAERLDRTTVRLRQTAEKAARP